MSRPRISGFMTIARPGFTYARAPPQDAPTGEPCDPPRQGRGRRPQRTTWRAAHRRGCRDLPPPTALPGLAEGETGPALRMLAQHRGVCPLDGLTAGEQVRAQPRLTAYDPVADAVVIADPDLLYSDAGGWVWRETKTSAAPLWEGIPLLENYPQLALAVVLMAAGVLGGDPDDRASSWRSSTSTGRPARSSTRSTSRRWPKRGPSWPGSPSPGRRTRPTPRPLGATARAARRSPGARPGEPERTEIEHDHEQPGAHRLGPA